MPSKQELKEMAEDMLNMDRDFVKEVCLDVMRTELVDYEIDRRELEQIKAGKLVVLPVNTAHAEAMFKLAVNYLGYWTPGEAFDLK